MAFPFFGKKLPPPPKPPKKATKKARKASRPHHKPAVRQSEIEQAMQFLKQIKGGLASMAKDMSAVQKKHEHFEKDISNIKKDTFSNNKKQTEELWPIRNSISDMRDSVSELKSLEEKNAKEEQNDIKKLSSDVVSIKSKDKEQDSKFEKLSQAVSDLKKADLSLKGLCDILHSDLSNLQSEAKEVMSTFRPATLKKLSSSLGAVSTAVKNMQAEQEETLKDFGKVTKSLSSIDRRALNVETESQKTQEIADDLSKMTQDTKGEITEARNEIIDMKNRFNVAINSTSEMQANHEEIKQRLMELERKMNSMIDLRSSVSRLAGTATELQNKVTTIEKTAVRTFVID